MEEHSDPVVVIRREEEENGTTPSLLLPEVSMTLMEDFPDNDALMIDPATSPHQLPNPQVTMTEPQEGVPGAVDDDFDNWVGDSVPHHFETINNATETNHDESLTPTRNLHGDNLLAPPSEASEFQQPSPLQDLWMKEVPESSSAPVDHPQEYHPTLENGWFADSIAQSTVNTTSTSDLISSIPHDPPPDHDNDFEDFAGFVEAQAATDDIVSKPADLIEPSDSTVVQPEGGEEEAVRIHQVDDTFTDLALGAALSWQAEDGDVAASAASTWADPDATETERAKDSFSPQGDPEAERPVGHVGTENTSKPWISAPEPALTSVQDDFGDFASGFEPNGQGTTPSHETPSVHEGAEKMNDMNSPDEMDFADDDDFGDFDSAPVEPHGNKETVGTMANREAHPTSQVGDLPGGSSEFPPPPPPEAPPVEAEPQRPPSEPTMLPNDDDGDDEFGDFSAFDENPSLSESHSPPPVPPMALPASQDDPVIIRLSTFVPKLFAKYSREPVDNSDHYNIDFDFSEITKILAAHPTVDPSFQTSYREKIAAHLAQYPPPRRAATKDIISPNVHVFNSHFSFPMEGWKSIESLLQRKTAVGTTRQSATVIPEVLSIQLPSGPNNPIDMASPETEEKEPYEPSQVQGVPAVPNLHRASGRNDLKAETEENDFRRLNDSVRRFLQQIPDLSHMLSSKLSLPKE